MQNFQNIIEICKQSFISAFSIYMTVPLNNALVTIFFYYQFFAVFCITWQIMNFKEGNYSTFWGQFDGVLKTVKKSCFETNLSKLKDIDTF